MAKFLIKYNYKPILVVAILLNSSFILADSYPSYQDVSISSPKKENSSPSRTFFSGKNSNSNFFENKSVTSGIVGNERKPGMGGDIFKQPSIPNLAETNKPIEPVPATENSEGESKGATSQSDFNAEANSGESLPSIEDISNNIQNSSNSELNDPKIRDVLEKTREIKEALFGKTAKENKKTPISIPGGTSKTGAGAKEDIGRF